jgi:hypothetical protein
VAVADWEFEVIYNTEELDETYSFLLVKVRKYGSCIIHVFSLKCRDSLF